MKKPHTALRMKERAGEKEVSFTMSNKKFHYVSLLVYGVIVTCFLFMLSACTTKIYTRPELEKFAEFACPAEYKEIVQPIVTELTVCRKEIFFLKEEVAEMKDRLWDAGSNHRVMKINDEIDIVKKEIWRLKCIYKEMFNTIMTIYPGYEEPSIVPYKGYRQRYEKIKKPIIIVSLEDQREYESRRQYDEKLFQDTAYKKVINDALAQYQLLQKNYSPGPTPIGAKGPVKKLLPKNE